MEKAVVKDGKVVGVIVNGEEIDCDMMVYNGDIKTAVNKVSAQSTSTKSM